MSEQVDTAIALLPLLKDSNQELVRNVISSLAKAANTNAEIARIIVQLLHEQAFADSRSYILKALSESGNHPGIVDAIMPFLGDNDEVVRRAAIHALEKAASFRVDVANSLLPFLEAKYALERSDAWSALEGAASNFSDIADAIVSLLSSKQAKVRGASVRALRSAASKRPDVLNAVLPLVNDKAVTVRDDAIFVVRNVAANNVNAALFLLPYLKDDEGNIDRYILTPLIKSIPLHKEVREIMITRLCSKTSKLGNETWEWLDTNVGSLSPEELAQLPS